MVSEREREIRERVDKATAGPWTPGRDDMQSYDGHTGEAFTNVYADNPKGKFHLGERLPLVVARAFDESGRNKADAAFIAHAREDVPWLLDALTTEREARLAAEAKAEHLNHLVATYEVSMAYEGMTRLRAEVDYLRSVLRDEPAGTPKRIIAAMFDEAQKRGHPPFAATHALTFLLTTIDTLRARLDAVEAQAQRVTAAFEAYEDGGKTPALFNTLDEEIGALAALQPARPELVCRECNRSREHTNHERGHEFYDHDYVSPARPEGE